MFDCIVCLCCRSEHPGPSSSGGSTEHQCGWIHTVQTEVRTVRQDDR